MKSTSTSCPMRGTENWPHPLPAHAVDTRTQHELFSSCVPCRSQWNCTFTRPCGSVWISSPAGPTTNALCVPDTHGRGDRRGGR
jgi:hypothetical protein